MTRTSRRPACADVDALLADTGPLPLNLDIDTRAASAEPGQARRRECSIGYHGECSARDGTGGCGCRCHPVLARIYRDHPLLGRCRQALAELEGRPDIGGVGLYSGWALHADLVEAGLTLTVADLEPDPYWPEDAAAQRRLARRLCGDGSAAGADYAAEVLQCLAQVGVAVTAPAGGPR